MSTVDERPTTLSVKQDACLHEGFLAWAERKPASIAVVCGTTRVTYGALAEQALHIAAELRALGCGPGEIVAVNAVRSADTVAGLLGVLMAGGAYLPIDPALPASRVKFVLDDCGVRWGVSEPGSHTAANVARFIDPSANDGCRCSSADFVSQTAPSDLAYVIFTSGSTGMPKGVMITHAAAMNTVDDLNERLAVGPRDRVLALSSFAFDLSVYDVFGILGAGGTVVLPTEDESRDPASWARLLREERVTIWNSVPALMEILLSYLIASGRELGSDLRSVLLSGDWISVTLPDRLRVFNPELSILSLGGATEASIWSIAYAIREVDPAWSSIPYGTPLANQHFYILNAGGEHCETGEIGELYIGGKGVALGYFNRPELSAERFLADLWSDTPGAVMYRTGDFGRFLVDGTIEFHGRIDEQIKINGHRIELPEIEARLAQFCEVSQCAVGAVGESPETRRLIAYVVPRNGALDEAALRSYLRQHLPAWMVPGSIVALASLPTNANGKIDRVKLQTLRSIVAHAGSHAQQSLIDRITTIWREVLQLDEVGIHDNFFDLGGDSLAAVLLFIRIEREFENAPSMAVLVEHPTIAGLVQLLGDNCSPKKGLVVPLQPHGDRKPLFVLPGVDGQLLVFRHLIEKLGAQQPVFGIQPRGLDGCEPDETIKSIAARSIAEMQRVAPSGPYRLAGFSTGGTIAFEMAQQLLKRGEQVALLVLFDAYSRLLPAPSLMGRASLHLRHLASLPLHDWTRHVGERAKIGCVKVRGLVRRTSRDQRMAEALNLSHNSTRVALANMRAFKEYSPKPYPGQGVLFRASIHPHCAVVANQLGWDGIFQSGLQIHSVPGTHADLLGPSHAESLAKQLRSLLDACQC